MHKYLYKFGDTLNTKPNVLLKLIRGVPVWVSVCGVVGGSDRFRRIRGQRNLASAVGLRVRSSSLKQDDGDLATSDDDEHRRPWQRRLFPAVAASLTWSSALRASLLLLLLAAIAVACVYLPAEKILKDFLLCVKQDLGLWGPFVLAIAYIPLTPASILALGGGYLFGLPVGFAADSIGATAAFLLGRTIERSYVISKLKDFPKFKAVAIGIQRSGFKIVLLLRLVPLLPFNMLNYLLSVTPVHLGEYMLASWIGMMPITFGLVYVGTTLKDLSDVTHGWNEVSKNPLVIIMAYVTKVAKASLEKALEENPNRDGLVDTPGVPIRAEPSLDLENALIIKIDPSGYNCIR